MLRIELRVGFRCVDPVRKLGYGGTPAETLEAIANGRSRPGRAGIVARMWLTAVSVVPSSAKL